jgi:hypothetical protein
MKHDLVPAKFSSRRAQTMPYGTRARVALAQGDIEGGLALAGVDRRAGTAIYALRIANQSASPLRARMECARFRGAPVLGYPLDVHVAPFAIAETLLPVRLSEVGPYDRAIVKVSGADVAFTLEAPAPPPHNTRAKWIGATATAIAVIFGGAFGAATAMPHFDLLAAPARALAGSQLDVPYAFRGWASMQYALQTKDGKQLAAGLLTQGQGTLHFSVPRNAGADLVLAASVSGPLGAEHLARRIILAPQAAAKPAVAAPRIDEFTIVTPQIRAGAPLQVHYSTNATAGQVWLLDETGRLWANVPISLDGTSVLKVPQGAAGHKMRVVLHARNGSADAVATVGAFVLPGDVVTAGAAASTASQAQLSLSLSSDRVSPGDEIVVTLAGNHGDARISLTDATGNTIEQGDLPSGQSAVTLTAPTVSAATSYYVVANVSSGVSEQSIVRKLTVAPR